MSKAIDARIRENETRLLDAPKRFIRIAGISTLGEHEGGVHRAAQLVAGNLRETGHGNIEIGAAAKHPPLYADWLHAPGEPAARCHAHYGGLHSPNEKSRIGNCYSGILTVTRFLEKYGAA